VACAGRPAEAGLRWRTGAGRPVEAGRRWRAGIGWPALAGWRAGAGGPALAGRLMRRRVRPGRGRAGAGWPALVGRGRRAGSSELLYFMHISLFFSCPRPVISAGNVDVRVLLNPSRGNETQAVQAMCEGSLGR